MTGGRASSWQVILADLSLILFLASMASLGQLDRAPSPERAGDPALSDAPPQAIYRADAGGMPFDQWLKLEQRDPRARLTIYARFAPGQQGRAAAETLALADEAIAQGLAPQIVLEPAQRPELWASFAFDDRKGAEAAIAQATITRSRPISLAR